MDTYSHLYSNKQTEVANQLDVMAAKAADEATEEDGYKKIG